MERLEAVQKTSHIWYKSLHDCQQVILAGREGSFDESSDIEHVRMADETPKTETLKRRCCAKK